MATTHLKVESLAKDLCSSAAQLAQLARTFADQESVSVSLRAQDQGVSMDISRATERFEHLVAQLIKALEAEGLIEDAALTMKEGTKRRSKDIGVYAKTTLWAALDQVADRRGDRPAVVYREMLRESVRRLDARLDKETSSMVFSEIGALMGNYEGIAKSQRTVRIDEDFYNKAIFIAQESGKSLSEITALCLAYGVATLEGKDR